MSNNLYKAGWVVVNDDTRVIDTNDLIKQKLKKAAESQMVYEFPQEDGEDGFTSGLEADNVDALFDSDSEGAVLKSASMEEQRALEQELEAARQELISINDEIARMREEAKADIEEMRANALEEAKTAGYQDGYEKGMAEAQVLKEQYVSMQTQLEEAYAEKIEKLEPEFIETMTGIYEHIFKVDLSSYHQLIVELLADAMQKMDTARNYIVHVSKGDYPVVNEARQKILEETGTLPDCLEIISDMTLSESQCMIETENGIYDCSLGTELEELKRKLKHLAYKKTS